MNWLVRLRTSLVGMPWRLMLWQMLGRLVVILGSLGILAASDYVGPTGLDHTFRNGALSALVFLVALNVSDLVVSVASNLRK